ncbi:MAG: hypothetical protein H7270_02585 [Dermatophilaceae bacterium]|nr:hypothetical protein [Dermatophilaceae bacterium]
MSNNGRLHTIRVPLRKICAALPAVALISGGIVFSASAAPIESIRGGAVASDSPAIVVPDVALTWPPATGAVADASRLVGPQAPEAESLTAKKLAQLLPAGTVPGSSSLVTLDSAGIPVRALEGYRQAATLTDSADPTCHLDWALLAAIGRVESNHARFGGNQLDSAGVAQPGIIGIPLDGSNGTARITDSDGGLLDRDTVYDRAVGPMQFIPGTWRVSGIDADGDGVKNPQDIADASTASAVYLCSGPGDLTRPDALRAAIWRYNASDSYVQMVTNIATAYRQGVRALPASDLAPAKVARSTSRAVSSRAVHAVSGAPVGAAPTTAVPTKAAPTTAVPTKAAPTTAVPTKAAPTTAVPTTAVPTTTTTTAASTTTVTCAPAPTTTDPATAEPRPTSATSTALPTPCAPAPCASGPDPTATATATACPALAAATWVTAPGSTP